MLLKKLFLSLALLAALASPAGAQVAVGISGGKFVTATDGSNLGSLNASSVSSGLLATARGGFGVSVSSLTANYICGGPDGTSGPVVCRLMTANDISFSIPNGKLANSSITIAAGSGVSVSGCSPVSLGGTCTVTATGGVGPTITGQSLWATPAVGEAGYLSSNNTWAKAKADVGTTVNAQALYEGTASTLSLGGSQSCLLVASLTLTAGDTLYLSDATAGRMTNVAPTTTGHYVYPLAVLVDTTGYNSGSGSAQPCVFRPGFIQAL